MTWLEVQTQILILKAMSVTVDFNLPGYGFRPISPTHILKVKLALSK